MDKFEFPPKSEAELEADRHYMENLWKRRKREFQIYQRFLNICLAWADRGMAFEAKIVDRHEDDWERVWDKKLSLIGFGKELASITTGQEYHTEGDPDLIKELEDAMELGGWQILVRNY